VAAEDQLKRIDLLAPQDGRSQQAHTIARISGEVLMLVVPMPTS